MQSPDEIDELRREIRSTLRKESLLPVEDPERKAPRKDHTLILTWNCSRDDPPQLSEHVRNNLRKNSINAYLLTDVEDLIAHRTGSEMTTIMNIARVSNVVQIICPVDSQQKGITAHCKAVIEDFYRDSEEEISFDDQLLFIIHHRLGELPASQVDVPLGPSYPTFSTPDDLLKKAGRDVRQRLINKQMDPPGRTIGLR